MPILIDAGAHTAIMSAMGSNRGKTELLTPACRVISKMAMHECVAMVQDETHVAGAQGMLGRREHIELQREGCTALLHLVTVHLYPGHPNSTGMAALG